MFRPTSEATAATSKPQPIQPAGIYFKYSRQFQCISRTCGKASLHHTYFGGVASLQVHVRGGNPPPKKWHKNDWPVVTLRYACGLQVFHCPSFRHLSCSFSSDPCGWGSCGDSCSAGPGAASQHGWWPTPQQVL